MPQKKQKKEAVGEFEAAGISGVKSHIVKVTVLMSCHSVAAAPDFT